MNARPGIGSMRDRGLMAHIDDAQTGTSRDGEHVIQVIADKGEYVSDAEFAERTNEELGPGHRRINSPSACRQR